MLKYSKTTIRELTKRYRAVLFAGIMSAVFVTTGANAVVVNLADNSGTVDVATTEALNGAVNTITSSINAETQARTAADTEINAKITENQDAIAQNASDIGALQDADDEIQDNIDAVSARVATNETKIANLQTSDATLQGNIEAESQARIDADTTLQDNIDTVQDNLDVETQARQDADITLQNNIDAVEARVTTNETNIANLQTSDTTLQGNIEAESQARIDADTTLQSNIDTLQDGLDGEAQARQDADTILQEDIDTLYGQVGDITTLKTTERETVVGSINEIVDNVTVVDGSYNYIVSGAGVADNLVALDNAVGSTTDGNYVQAANTVGQNLNALDAKIGVVTDGAQVAAGNTIGQNINALDNAIGNRSIDSTNASINDALKTNVAAAFTATGNAIGDMNFENTRYVGARSDLSSAVRSLDSAVSHLDHRVDTLEDETKAGFASTAALAGLVPNARANGNTQLAIGTGAYRGSVGGAVGLYHYINDNVLVNAGFSYAGDKSAIGKAGVTFGW